MMGSERLSAYMLNNFGLVQHHKWSLADIEGMIPWERVMYMELLANFLKEEEQKQKDMLNEMKAMRNYQNRRKL